MSWKKLLKEAGPGAAPPPSLPAAAAVASSAPPVVVGPLAGASGAVGFSFHASRFAPLLYVYATYVRAILVLTYRLVARTEGLRVQSGGGGSILGRLF